MTDIRTKAAVLSAVLPDPANPLAMAMRSLGPALAWECFTEGHPSIPEAARARWRRCDPTLMVDRGHAAGARIVIPEDAEWPVQLDALGPQRPWALWVRGAAFSQLARTRSVAVVGARSCTAYGERVAAELAATLAGSNHPVVSGGAYGIDAAAHRGALAVDGITCSVLASGVDVAYPAAHSALFERIAGTGALVSEAAPGAHPTKPAFLVRNRLIAALTYGTVVVEARLRSGSYSTYSHARSLGRTLMAVPGPVDSAESAGPHALLREDAQLVTCAEDVISLIAPIGTVMSEPERAKTEWDTLAPAERIVHEAMPARSAVTIDELLVRTDGPLAVPELLAALATLARRGILAEQPDGRWRRTRRLRGAAA